MKDAASPFRWLDVLRLEQQQVVDAHGSGVSWAALVDMPLVDAVVTELLRITPAVPTMFRKAVQVRQEHSGSGHKFMFHAEHKSCLHTENMLHNT